ncbi:MAG: hypothetical protein K0Q62_2365 [Phenylobacterium sp.]|jgi:hypothetical protein|nr:hypothetical protein [Phenylobacterium sp.]
MARRPHVVPSLALVALLSACGQSVAAPQPPAPADRPPAPVATPAPPARGLAVLDGVRRRLASCRGFDTEMTSRGEGTWDDGVDTGVRRTNRNRAKLSWHKPNRLHGEMLEAPFALMVGGTLDTPDGEALTLRPSGWLSVVAMNLKSTDVKLRNSRNHTFRDSQPAAQLARLTAGPATWTLLVDDGETVTLDVTGVRRLDSGIAREVLVLAATDFAPRSLTMLSAGRPVVSLTFKGFRWR